MALALAHPQQSSFRIAADRGLHQLIQGCQKSRLCLGCWLAATPLSANPRAEHHRARTQVCQAAIDRAARNPRRPRYRNNPAMSGRTRLTGREQPPLSLVQNWLKRLEASPDGIDVNHRVRVSAPAPEAHQFLNSFVALLPVSRFFSSDSVVLAQALSRYFGLAPGQSSVRSMIGRRPAKGLPFCPVVWRAGFRRAWPANHASIVHAGWCGADRDFRKRAVPLQQPDTPHPPLCKDRQRSPPSFLFPLDDQIDANLRIFSVVNLQPDPCPPERGRALRSVHRICLRCEE